MEGWAQMTDVHEPRAESVLEITGLRVAYGPRTVVDGLTLDVGRGEIFGLLGPNGAGKTSTLGVVEGLIAPVSGRVSVNGLDVHQHPWEVKSLLGVQLQSSSFQDELSIAQIVKLYGGLYGVQFSPGQISGSLDSIGLGGEGGKRFKQLSGGQQQRLGLFIATLHNPKLLLLD